MQAVDDDGKPAAVSKPTKIKLKEVSGPGDLGGNTTAVIPAGLSSTTIEGATYSQFANGVKLKVKVVYGDDLAPDKITVEVALTAVGADATPGSRVDSGRSRLSRPNRGGAELRHPSSEERCKWSRHLVSRLL